MFDVLNITTYIKNGQEHKKFTRCGVAFPRKEKEGYVLKLDVQNTTGEYLLSPKRKREQQEKQ